MRAGHGHKIGKPGTDALTMTVQLTREDAERLLQVLTAALSAAGKKPSE